MNENMLGYTGPAPTVLRNGRAVAPGSPIDPEELEAADAESGITAERDFYEAEGWLEEIAAPGPLRGAALDARARELGVEGRTQMNVDELRAAVEKAEGEHVAQADEGGE